MKCPVSGAKSASVYLREIRESDNDHFCTHRGGNTIMLSSIAFENNGAPTLTLPKPNQ